MNEKLQLLDLAAEISKKPSREECCFTAGTLLFSTGTSRKMRECGGFTGAARRKETAVAKPKRYSLQVLEKKSPPRLKGHWFFFNLGALKNT